MDELPLNYQRQLAALQPPETYRDPLAWLRDRLHTFLADPNQDGPAKRSARARGDATVRCPCRCGQEYPV